MQKFLHPKRTAEDLDLRWSASDLQVKIYGELEKCGVKLKWIDPAAGAKIEAAVVALIDRRHRIAHHADLPSTEVTETDLAANVIHWAHAAVIMAAEVLKNAFPELRDTQNADLSAKVERVLADWQHFSTQIYEQAGLAMRA